MLDFFKNDHSIVEWTIKNFKILEFSIKNELIKIVQYLKTHMANRKCEKFIWKSFFLKHQIRFNKNSFNQKKSFMKLQDEKTYSGHLKTELDKLHERMVGAGLGEGPSKGEDEVAYYMQQIQMLEAGKTMGRWYK